MIEKKGDYHPFGFFVFITISKAQLTKSSDTSGYSSIFSNFLYNSLAFFRCQNVKDLSCCWSRSLLISFWTAVLNFHPIIRKFVCTTPRHAGDLAQQCGWLSYGQHKVSFLLACLSLRNSKPEDIPVEVLPHVAKLHFKNVKKAIEEKRS